MSGYENHNFPAFFAAEDLLTSYGYEPLNPARCHTDGNMREGGWRESYEHAIEYPAHWHEYIKADVALLLRADSIVLLNEWHKSKGACLELIVAVNTGLRVYAMFDGQLRELSTQEIEQYYDLAVAHLASCSLGGVKLASDGTALYQ